MNPLIDGASVIAVVEFIKRIAGRVGINFGGEVTIVLAVLVGGAIAAFNNTDVIQGGLIGAAAVGVHTTARSMSGK